MNLKYFAPCYCHQTPCVCAAWERRLRREDLAHFDYVDENDPTAIVPGNKGSGKPKNEDVAANREKKAAYRDWCQSVLHTQKFTAVERQVWERHAQGRGNLSIAVELELTEWGVRTTVNDIKARARAPRRPTSLAQMVCRADPALLALLLTTLAKE